MKVEIHDAGFEVDGDESESINLREGYEFDCFN